MSNIIKFIIISNVMIWVSIIEVIAHSTLYIFGNDSAKWHAIGWILLLTITLGIRAYFKLKSK